jgi:hypothetical protein
MILSLFSSLAQDCGLNDDALGVLGKRIWRMKKVQLTGCNFSYKGLGALTFKMTDQANALDRQGEF